MPATSRPPPFNFDSNTALELTTRLVFLGSQALTAWYTCAVGGGCGATGGYLLFLAADDDDGNLDERHAAHDRDPRRLRAPRDPLRDAGRR